MRTLLFLLGKQKAKLYISTFKYKKENIFPLCLVEVDDCTGFFTDRSLIIIHSVTCARYHKLYTVLKIKWEIEKSKHLITMQDLHAVIKEYRVVWVKLTLTCDGGRNGGYRNGGLEEVTALLSSEAINSFFWIKGMGVGKCKV